MKYVYFAIIFFLILLACGQSPKVHFEQSGVSFTCSAGWKITEEEDIENNGYYLSVEKDGFDASGLLTITWVNDSLYLENILDNFQEDLKNNMIFRYTNIEFDETQEDVFGKIPALSRKYKVSLLGLAHEGYLYAFYGNNKTFVVIKQEALEDKIQNKSGFEIMESSLRTE